MAELDYAFIADSAQVEQGRLFVLGGSFTHVRASGFPSSLQAAVAGRVRTRVGTGPVEIGVSISPPGDKYKINLQGLIQEDSNARPYDGDKIGILFAVTFDIPLVSAGLYTLELNVDGEHARRLAFDVEASDS